MNLNTKIQILFVILIISAMPAWSQTNTPPPTPPPAGSPPPAPGGELRQKLQQMTPEQREQFLQNHPRIREQVREHEAQMIQRYQNMTPAQQAQFAQNHPEAAQRIANASEAGPGKSEANHPRVNEVNQREQNQQNRITQGEKSGQLTPGEASRIDKGENRLQKREEVDMANHGGHLTAGEDRRLNRDENHLSREIDRDKHNERKE